MSFQSSSMNIQREWFNQCSSCKTEWMNRLDYHNHMTQHIDITNNQCKLCYKIFASQHNVRNHIAYAHSSKTWASIDNGKINIAPITEKNQMSPNWRPFAQVQNTVNSWLNNVTNVASNIPQGIHYPTLHPKPSTSSQSFKSYACRYPKCGATFPNNSELHKHIQNTHFSGKRLSCKQCSYNTNKQASLDMHIRFSHRFNVMVLDKKCQDCTSSFSEERTLEKHLRIVHNKSMKEHACNKCPIILPFDSKQELDSHNISFHPQGKEDKVSVMGNVMSAEAKAIVQYHGMRLMYPKVPLHQCEKCSAILCNELDLEEHDMEQHSTANTSTIPLKFM